MRKTAVAVQKPALANVDLRADVVATIQTEPPVSNFGKYNPYSNMGKPLKVTATVENAGITKADKVAIGVFFSRMPGVPMKQNAWEYHYVVDLGPGEVVSYPFDILFHSTMVTFTVNGEFAGDEKNKGNNTSQLYVKF
ncbi:MAG: hypothetical protein HZB86_03935 [Deltaproteobacteria bacterium]|nr:hypothetical protein [Deltaproteobacteria bacterium]